MNEFPESLQRESISQIRSRGLEMARKTKSTEKKQQEKKAIAVVLFSGGGGVEAGMIEAGIEPILAVEYDPDKPELSEALAASHEANFPRCKVIRCTVQECAAKNFKGFPQEPDILWASPVCANFSAAKNGKEQSGDIEAAKAVIAAIKKLKPKHFFLENVPSYGRSQSWQQIESILPVIGYRIGSAVIDMSDYGVPQARRRFIAWASRDKEPFPLPESQEKKTSWYEALADLIPDLPESQLLKGQQQSVDEFLESSNQPTPLLIDRSGGRARYRAVPSSRSANTILRSHFTDGKGGNRTKFADIWLPDGTVKSVSIECMARLQSFPKWYQFPDQVAIAGSIIGYSVPPKFVEQLVTAVTAVTTDIRSEHEIVLDEIAEVAKEMECPNAMPTLEYGGNGNGNHALAVQTSSKSDEQYTPDVVIEAALATLEVIDLDPCSSSKTEPNIPAANHYTKEDDGLEQTWAIGDGRIYLNPPYSDTAAWVDKLIEEYALGAVKEAVVLVKSATDTQWYQKLDKFPKCLWNGRLKFKNPSNNGSPAPFASTVFYLGDRPERFRNAFSPHGRVHGLPDLPAPNYPNLGKVLNGAAVPCPIEVLSLLSSNDFIKHKDEAFCYKFLKLDQANSVAIGHWEGSQFNVPYESLSVCHLYDSTGSLPQTVAYSTALKALKGSGTDEVVDEAVTNNSELDGDNLAASANQVQTVETSWGVFQWNDEVLLWASKDHKKRIDWEGLECLILEENGSQKLVIPYGSLPINKDGSKPPVENARFRKPWWIGGEELYAALSLAEIRRDGGTQPREKLDLAHVATLKEALEDGAELNPVAVFYDGESYWLADGFHRCKASQDAGLDDIQCIIYQGTRRDAVLYSVGANAEHKAAKPRSRNDKRRAVTMLLNDPEWSKWSNYEVARQCKVSEKTVRNIRARLTTDFRSESRTYTTKHGTTATMQTGNIGKAEGASISGSNGNGNGKINRPANRWYGGKWRIGKWIASHFPEHKIYVEPFGGMWSVGLQKPQSEIEIYNDIHPLATNFWTRLKEDSERLIQCIDAIQWNEETVKWAKEVTTDPFESAVKFYIQCRIAYAGGGTGWGSGYSPKSFDKKENSDHSHLIAIANRIKNLQIYGEDALDIIRKFDSPDTLFYCDPPYVKETRNSHTPYEYEFDRHEELITLLSSIQGKAILSGYPSFKYASLLSGWDRKDTQGMTTSSKDAMECIWIKPTEPAINPDDYAITPFSNGNGNGKPLANSTDKMDSGGQVEVKDATAKPAINPDDYAIAFLSNLDSIKTDLLKEARERIDAILQERLVQR